MSDQPNRRRTEELVASFMYTLKAHYERGPQERARVFEALNALAATVAWTLEGTDTVAVRSFFDALTENLGLVEEIRVQENTEEDDYF